MARIELESIRRVDKERNTVHSKVCATYSIFNEADEKYIQIDTYGSADREIPGKISQSIQFDHETAQFLLDLFIKEYGLLVELK